MAVLHAHQAQLDRLATVSHVTLALLRTQLAHSVSTVRSASTAAMASPVRLALLVSSRTVEARWVSGVPMQ